MTPPPQIVVSIAAQTLTLNRPNAAPLQWQVSTAARGAGEQNGSLQTPRGWHKARAKIGANAPLGAVFRARRLTGEVYSPQLASQYPPDRDWILTRILWLSGCEVGKNRLGNVDTMRRYIYIHGASPAVAMGAPGSRGCIRMTNADVARLFDLVEVGASVLIE